MSSNKKIVKNLEPKKVFEYFAEISDIPRGSGNTDKITDYLVNFAISNSLEYKKDDFNNVIITKKTGNKKYEAIALQAHTDMVCVKTSGNKKDMSSDGIDFLIDGKYLTADGTSLGADDGIGVAIILAILADNKDYGRDIVGIFTSDEEIGLIGAHNIDLSNVKVSELINIDSEDFGVAVFGCAGGSQLEYEKRAKLVSRTNGTLLILKVSGLLGGHSGMEITKNRGNANKILINVLYKLCDKTKFNLISVDGGVFDNAIPNKSEAKILISESVSDKELISSLNQIIEEEVHKYKATEPGLSITFDSVNTSSNVEIFNDESTKSILSALSELPDGLISTFENNPDIAKTSLNMGILKTSKSSISFVYLVRSNVNEERINLVNKIYTIATKYGFEKKAESSYPAWEYKENRLEDRAIDIFKKTFESDLKVEVTHGGLECGILLEKMGDASAIAIGPTLLSVHSVDEKLDIETVGKTYNFITEFLMTE
ncbi:MAG: beta-Ala-His dipeptidase [Lachnospiraceae bacterium]|nr:beta-Ala-His dipeptidase [Lachnospiraceae bacterium]